MHLNALTMAPGGADLTDVGKWLHCWMHLKVGKKRADQGSPNRCLRERRASALARPTEMKAWIADGKSISRQWVFLLNGCYTFQPDCRGAAVLTLSPQDMTGKAIYTR